jgi:hypothetical protein
VFLSCLTLSVAAAPPEPIFLSNVITAETPGNGVEIDVDLTGAK